MSGAEVIGLISGTIAIINAVTKVYDAVTDASGLPEAFRDVAQRLPLIKDTLQTALAHLNTSSRDNRFYQAMMPVVDGCKDKATRLEKIFLKVIPQADSPRSERYVLAVRTLGKGSRVESLMKGMLEDLQLLAGNRMMKLATEAQLGELAKAAEEVSAIPPSLLVEDPASGIHNYGSGPQNVNTGSGSQLNNNGGQLFVGGTFTGPFNFST